jgi:hypothetical protein
MRTCFNHPDKKALSICHGCGKDYCEECLDEGLEYYYCRRPECHSLLLQELSHENRTENHKNGSDTEKVTCPNCKTEIELTEDEIEEKMVHCPECESLIDLRFDPPYILQKDNYVELLSSLNQGDIAVLKSILDDGQIDYYAFGENTLGTQPFLFPVRFFVNADQLELAKELLKNFDLRIFGTSANNYKDGEDTI